MKQFAHYTQWEDFLCGMYRLPSVQDNGHAVILAKGLLTNQPLFYERAVAMVSDWSIAALVNLSNRSRNRCAWIGQATCCFEFGSAEHQTKEAWHTMSPTEQRAANATASDVIKAWEDSHA